MQKQQYKFFIFTLTDQIILLCKQTYPSKNTSIFEREVQPHDIVKLLGEEGGGEG